MALVEFALVLPVLALILFGTIEFGWAYAQQLDVRHGAREGARLAAVSYLPTVGDDQVDSIGAEVCARMDRADGATVTMRLDGTNEPGAGTVVVTVSAPLEQITGFFDVLLDGVGTLDSTVSMLLERELEWDGSEQSYACPT